MILLDTHTLVWLDEGSDRLGEVALSHINSALAEDELFVATISFWEVAMLANKSRITIPMGVKKWRASLLENGLKETDLNGTTAIESAMLDDFHGDPADRMIVATALHTNAILCTADQKILDWKSDLKCLDARL